MKKLYTREGEHLPQIPWRDYPRPQLRREDWLCLNGTWQLQIEKDQAGGGSLGIESVLVPFCPESLLSGVKNPPEPGDRLVYRRRFALPEGWRGKRILLHFGAVGRDCTVCVNGQEVGRHENGYLAFTLDITWSLRQGDNELLVSAVNDLDRAYPWGKQTQKRGGMWYTPCSGIWQTVWLEPVPDSYIRDLQIRTGRDWAEIEAEGVRQGSVLFEGREIPLRDGKARIEVPEPRLWSPENPYLYEFELLAGEDRVRSYFALRTLTVERVKGVQRLCLNGKPYFFHGLLDQGYWSDGLYTPATPEGFERDILAMKALGFNTLRKHIKVEPERFYYDCDRLGMVVFQDMVNNGVYHYISETVLPTIGWTWSDDRLTHRNKRTRREFLRAMEGTVKQLQNHPCICYWTIFNEGWGQFCSDEAYERLRALDDSRFIDSTSGWFRQKKSDVESLHIYFHKLALGRQDRPQVLSEFGGYVWKVPEHSFNQDETYGYKKFEDRESMVQALQSVYRDTLVPLAGQGLCGAIYTQVSDVEDETNGLVTFDRRLCKVKPEELREIGELLQKAVEGE